MSQQSNKLQKVVNLQHHPKKEAAYRRHRDHSATLRKWLGGLFEAMVGG
jgi:hypothetical protein